MVSEGGTVLRALPFHQCSNPGIGVIFWLSLLLVFSFVTRGFPLSTIIVLLKNQHFKILIQQGMDDEEPLSGFPTS